MTCLIEAPVEDKGVLVNNYMTVRQLRQVLGDADHALTIVPCLVKEVIEDRCYVKWLDPHSGLRGGFAPHEFRRFIEAKGSEGGLETPLSVVRRFLGDDTPERLLFEDAIRGNPGGERPDQPRTDDGSFMGRNRDDVTVADDSPSTIPLSQGLPRPRVRDYDGEAPTGNSTSYAIRQLDRGRTLKDGTELPPRKDLLERVRVGEITVNAAMIEGGFRKPTISLPVDPEAATRLIVKHFQGEALAELIELLVAAVQAMAEPADAAS